MLSPERDVVDDSATDSGTGDVTERGSGGACEGGSISSGAVIEDNIARSIFVGSGVPGVGSIRTSSMSSSDADSKTCLKHFTYLQGGSQH